MTNWIATILAAAACWAADEPRSDEAATDTPPRPPGVDRPDRPPGPPRGDRPDRRAGPRDQDRPDRPPGRRQPDADPQRERGAAAREQRRPMRPFIPRRDGDNWIYPFVELVVPASGDGERPPLDLSRSSHKLKLEDGRELEVRRPTPPRHPIQMEGPAFRVAPPRAGGPTELDDHGPPHPPGPPAEREDGRHRPTPPGMPPGPPASPLGLGMPPDPEIERLIRKQTEVEHRAQRLAMAYRDPARGEEEKEKLKDQLHKAVAEQFTLRQEARELSLARMRRELERLENAIHRRAESRDSLIQRRVDQLIEKDSIDF